MARFLLILYLCHRILGRDLIPELTLHQAGTLMYVPIFVKSQYFNTVTMSVYQYGRQVGIGNTVHFAVLGGPIGVNPYYFQRDDFFGKKLWSHYFFLILVR